MEIKSKYTKKVRITEYDLKWLKKNKDKLSIAGFLEMILYIVKVEKKPLNGKIPEKIKGQNKTMWH